MRAIDERAGLVRGSAPGGLLRKLKPKTTTRPWRVLSDGEMFLHSEEAETASVARSISLWEIPAHSPDRIPTEKFWSWLRRELKRLDARDPQQKRRPLTKQQYIERVKDTLPTESAQRKAANIAAGFRKVLKEVAIKQGVAVRS